MKSTVCTITAQTKSSCDQFSTIKTCRNVEPLDHHRRLDAEKTPLENYDRNISNMIHMDPQTTPEQDPGHPTPKGVNTSRKYLAPALT